MEITRKTKQTFLADQIETTAHDMGLYTYYDMNIDNAPHRLVYTDFMNCLGGVYVCTGSSTKNERLITQALHGKVEDYTNYNYTQAIAKALDDKYNLRSYLSKQPIQRLVVLPGSNILGDIVDDTKLVQAVSDGAWVKPHPYTNIEDLQYLRTMFGNKVLDPLTSGSALVKQAKHVYTTGSSELFMYSIALGKNVHDISKDKYPAKGGYQALFKVLMKYRPYERPLVLNKILSYKHGGIFFPFDSEEKSLNNYIQSTFKK
jgi:hypothetical protein